MRTREDEEYIKSTLMGSMPSAAVKHTPSISQQARESMALAELNLNNTYQILSLLESIVEGTGTVEKYSHGGSDGPIPQVNLQDALAMTIERQRETQMRLERVAAFIGEKL